MTIPQVRTVNIRPKVTVLSVLSHLEYKPWFALAEFVDNALQSFSANRYVLRPDQSHDPLRVSIDVDSGLSKIRIADNAAGIALSDFPRAFRPAEIPPDTSGLSEFGMGMKTAACWFSPLWRVTTSAVGEAVERTVVFDIDRIVNDQLEDLEISAEPADAAKHYTVIELERVRAIPTGRTSGKIREHLADIYREFLRDGSLVLTYRGDPLEFKEEPTLVAPRYDGNNRPDGPDIEWRKKIDFDFGLGQRVRGFAGLRQTGSTRYAGFSLFRRRRVIQGSGDEKYRPREIFGAPNSFVSQRLHGELHLEGFEVSHTKDGFRWQDAEEGFLALLKEHLDSDDMPLLRQARNYRESAQQASVPNVLGKVVDGTASALSGHGGADFGEINAAGPDPSGAPEDLGKTQSLADRAFDVVHEGVTWHITLELSADPTLRDWLQISEVSAPDDGVHAVRLRIALEAEFMRRLVRLDDAGQLEPIVRLAAGLGLSEHLARAAGLKRAGEVRRNLNRLLARSLAWSGESTEERDG